MSEREMEDEPFEVLKKACCISSSQEDLLSHSNFARQDDFHSFSGDAWPEFSSPSSSDAAAPVITICSAPETPESHQKDDDGGTTATTPQHEEFKTPPEVAAPNSASSDDVVYFGKQASDSPELRFLEARESPDEKREREEESSEVSPSAKKLKGSDNLGFMETTQQGEGTVVLESEDNDDEVEQRENVEQTRKGGVTEVKNGVDESKGGIENEILEVSVEMSETSKLKLKLNLEANADLKEDGLNLMKCLIDALMKVSGGIQEGGKDEPVDIFETAKQRGMTFPRSRWYDRE